ncbi:DNA-binding transcription factor yap1, partial [Linderina pennispora]
MTTIATASIADSKPAHITPHKRNTESDSDESHDDKKHKKPGRKPIMTEASSKRTAQNRAAQRAFRERKQNYLRSLEEKVKELAEQQERTVRENEALKQRVDKLHNENLTLRNGKFTYDEPPAQVDFDKAIADLFDTSSTQTPAALSLSSTFDLQQAALQGADLTKPGAMEAIQPNARKSNSPQSVPTMYPGNVDLSSVTANSLVSGLSQTTKAGSALVGSNPMIGGTSPSLTTGFSNDIMNGIQLLAANQNVSTGSFIQQFLNSSGNTTPTTVPISPDSFTRRASTLSSTAGASSTQSPALSNPLATPGD